MSILNINPFSPENSKATFSEADEEENADQVTLQPTVYSAAFFRLSLPRKTLPSKSGSFLRALVKYHKNPRHEQKSSP